MRVKNNGVKLPWWCVIVGFVIAAPLGFGLLIAKLVLDADAKKRTPSVSPAKTDIEKNRISKRKLKRKSKVWQIIAVILLGCGALCWCVAIGDAISGELFSAADDLSVGLFFLFAGMCCALAAIRLRRREENFARYLVLIGEEQSVHLSKLCAAVSRRASLVKRELQMLIDDGFFGAQAYIDETTSCFMRSPGALPDKQSPPTEQVYTHTVSSSTENICSKASVGDADYDAVLAKIRSLDDVIADEAVSVRIGRIERLTRHIFEYVGQRNDRKNQIRAFMNYYLPTSLKLLESYSRIERVGTVGQNILQTKTNIEDALDKLVSAFEAQLDSLYSSENIDISSDIEVLEQMMSRDGLTENTDFSAPSHRSNTT